jgi:hypothetical protein
MSEVWLCNFIGLFIQVDLDEIEIVSGFLLSTEFHERIPPVG